MLTMGMMFHQIDLLGAQGLTEIEGAANFLPQTVAAVLATLVTGGLIDRFRPRFLVAMAMIVLGASRVVVFRLQPRITARHILRCVAGCSAGSYARR